MSPRDVSQLMHPFGGTVLALPCRCGMSSCVHVLGSLASLYVSTPITPHGTVGVSGSGGDRVADSRFRVRKQRERVCPTPECGGTASMPRHPCAVRWRCDHCAMSFVNAVEDMRVVGAHSAVWLTQATAVHKGKELHIQCAGHTVVTMCARVALVLRDIFALMCPTIASETAVTVFTLRWCVTWRAHESATRCCIVVVDKNLLLGENTPHLPTGSHEHFPPVWSAQGVAGEGGSGTSSSEYCVPVHACVCVRGCGDVPGQQVAHAIADSFALDDAVRAQELPCPQSQHQDDTAVRYGTILHSHEQHGVTHRVVSAVSAAQAMSHTGGLRGCVGVERQEDGTVCETASPACETRSVGADAASTSQSLYSADHLDAHLLQCVTDEHEDWAVVDDHNGQAGNPLRALAVASTRRSSSKPTAAQRKEALAWLKALPKTVHDNTTALLTNTACTFEAVLQAAAHVDVEFVPWTRGPCAPSPLWDVTVRRHCEERSCQDSPWSPFTPVFHASAAAQTASATKLSGDAWAKLLRGHPHAHVISNSATYGFPLLSSLPPCQVDVGHREFSSHDESKIAEWVFKQCAAGTMVDITDVQPSMVGSVITPFTVVEKSGGAVGERRICHDLSMKIGKGMSVNDYIQLFPLEPTELLSLHSVVTRLRYCIESQPHVAVWAARVDMRSYFRQLPTRRRDTFQLLQRSRGKVYTHTALTFGGRSAPHIATLVSSALVDIMCAQGAWAGAFVDDIVMVGSQHGVRDAVTALRGHMRALGLVEAEDKYVDVCQGLAILGVWFDLHRCKAWVTPERSKRIQHDIGTFLTASNGKATLQQFQQLSGKLMHISAVVPHGVSYVAPFWDALAGSQHLRPHHRVHITSECRAALVWWQRTLATTTAITASSYDVGLRPSAPLTFVVGIRTDASGAGYGGVALSQQLYIVGKWELAESAEHAHTARHTWSVNVAELATIVFMLAALATRGVLSGNVVVLQTDSLCSVCALTRYHSVSPVLRFLVRACVWIQQTYRFLLVPRHIGTTANTESDGLSRGAPPSDCLPGYPARWLEIQIPPAARALGRFAFSRAALIPKPEGVASWQASTTGIVSSLGGMHVPTETSSTTAPFIPCSARPRWEVKPNKPSTHVTKLTL